LQQCAWAHREAFVDKLIAKGKDKVVCCQYRRRDDLGAPDRDEKGLFYIHSKTWIFDDQYLVTGSANCNRRGYSHDSELDFGVVDTTGDSVKNLRVRLWKKRLNTEGCKKPPLSDAELNDFLGAAKYWEKPRDFGLTIETDPSKAMDPKVYHDLDFDSYKAKVTKAPGAGPEMAAALDSVGKAGIWEFIVDPEGT
jgi:phosphatidylserine/phosphatidylglycerophosphate/cardiolipin synthase-like enzyme